MRVQLRPVEPDDLPILFTHQADAEAARMARFPPRDRDAFLAHWERIVADPTAAARAIVSDGEVVGNVGSWDGDGGRLLGYWVGREHWGRGIATVAVTAFPEVERTRPLHAFVATTNIASIRVLEKCGFARVDARTSDDDVEELVFRLD